MPERHRVKQIFQDVDIEGKLTATSTADKLKVDDIANEANADLPIYTGATSYKALVLKYLAGTLVNWIAARGSAAAAAPAFVAEGSDTDIDVALIPKGTGIVDATGGGNGVKVAELHSGADVALLLKTGATKVTQALIKHVASVVNQIGIKGAAAGSDPELAMEGSDTDVGLKVTPKGAGRMTVAGGLQALPVAVVATADGLTTGLIPKNTSVVTVTVTTDANDIITLPAVTASEVGMRICVYVGATGCEVRTPATGGATINNVDSDGTNELALAANSSFTFECTAADTWVVRGFNNLGADLAALVPDAA